MTNRLTIALVFVLCIVLFAAPAAAYTTELTVTKYDPYGAVIDTRTITWEEMRDTLPVYGDGVTHYYMHGPTFDDSSFDALWDPIEEVNIDTRDYGAAMGTDVKDLCDLVGGAEPGDTVQIKAADNFNKWFDYEDVYHPEPEQGTMVITWYTADTADGDDGSVGDGHYSNGMRLLFFADTSTNPWGWNVYGNWDMHETLPASRWHYYYGGGFWPSSSGLSVKYVAQINIYQPNLISCDASGNPVDSFAPGETVYVKGMGLDAETSYTLWIQGEPVLLTPLDKLERPVIGGTYVLSTANNPSGAQETVATDASGDFAPVAIWTAAETLGKYDIVADNLARGTVGTYGSYDEIDNPGWEGFEVAVPTVPPVAGFSAGATSGVAPLTVSFTDASTGTAPLVYAWDFEDDGTVDSTERNPVHAYTDAGTYTVNLTVTNAYGSDTETKTDYVTVYAMLPVHNLNTGARYLTIQEAVDAASAGDVLEVGDGSYTENVLVDKALTIRSENGTAAVTVTAASPALPVFDIDADGVTIEGFTVRGPTDTHVAGIEIVGYDNCRVTANDCAGCYNGIHIGGDGTGNIVTDNYCHENTRRGISVRDTAYGNSITGNTVENNADAGICIKDMTHDNVLWLNDVINNRVEILTANTAHSPEPLTYSYQGGVHTGHLGNYYYDYSGTDADGDGVGTPSYSYGTYGDDYPLMAPCSNYAETVLFFWGPYLTGTTTTATVVNVKTPEAATVTVEYADDAYYTAHGGYEHSATGEAGAELHHIELTGLSPGTLYHYRVVRSGAATADLHVRTLPESGTFSFVAYGDSQDQLPQFSQDERHKLVADRIAGEEDVAFLLHSGDLVNDATLTTDWDRFFSAGGAMLANVTIFPAMGNHEKNATLYYDIFGVPEYYSFDAGNAHFTLLDSNDWAWPKMDEQTAWLEADLATPADWNFVTFHHPPYTSEESHWGGYTNIREEWEDIFIANGVDVVTNGEVHVYERYEVNGITYMVLGIGGGPSYPIAEEKIEGYQNSLENTLGYAKVTIDPQAGTATVEIKPVAEIATDGSGVAYIYPEGSVYETFVLELPTGPRIWYVDDDGGADFATIQAAVDAAKAGDMVVVKDGHYIENVDISKRITLESEHGAASTIIETANPMSVDSVIEVTADFVNITGFTLTMADVGGSGIYLIDADNCTITDTVSETNGWGIRLKNATHNVIRNTTNIDCYRGIALYEGSNENLIEGNEVSWNADYGIWLEGSHANTIVRNNASGAEGGGAFNLRASHDNIIAENVLDCYDPEGPHGLTLEWGSTNNRIYLNNFKNTILPANGDATGNLWVSPEPVDYTCGSAAFSSLLGNYWDRYTGADLDGNGIGDTPYIVPDGLGTDSYPLMGEWQDGEILYSAPPAPTVDFSANVTSGDAPLTVQFTDQSLGEDMVDWAWDFDSDGTVDATARNPICTYNTPGTYTVSLTVTNAGGSSDDEVKVDFITVNVPPVPPTAAFTADVTSGDAPLTVRFTDASTGDAPLSWSWDFDNDGIIDSTEQNPTFTYATAGTYTVSLTVTNIAGSDSEVKEGYIIVTAPPVLTAITVSPDAATLLAGESQQFSATAYDQYGTEMTGLTFSWSSSDASVGTITADGSFTAVQAGTTTVTATSGTVSGSAEVSVMESGAATPLDRAIDLEMYVGGLDLPAGITNALLAKLDGVVDGLRAMEDAESGPGENKPGNAANHGAPGLKPIQNRLTAFTNQVEALQGKKIPAETADELLRMAEDLLALLADSG
ncbi:MAG: PKD domain-containing protein [Methanomicrobiaceae archaeon]|nr:PKD domain-containing protein [Methanomicrobiaceae archaeon]